MLEPLDGPLNIDGGLDTFPATTVFHPKTRQDKTRQDKTRQDKTRQDKTRQDKTRQDQKTDKHKTQTPTFLRLVKKSSAPSAVTSKSPYLLRLPDSPPKANGSRGTGIPTFTPAYKLKNHRREGEK